MQVYVKPRLPLWRALVCHVHSVSARLHFLIPKERGVCLPWHLPALSVFAEEQAATPLVEVHPALMRQQLMSDLGLAETLFKVPGFRVCMQTAEGIMPVYLFALSEVILPEPPDFLHWIEMPDSVVMPWLERELLRCAYEHLFG